MDPTADPCQDFFQYACGGWMKNNPIPKSKSGWSQFDILNDKLTAILKGKIIFRFCYFFALNHIIQYRNFGREKQRWRLGSAENCSGNVFNLHRHWWVVIFSGPLDVRTKYVTMKLYRNLQVQSKHTVWNHWSITLSSSAVGRWHWIDGMNQHSIGRRPQDLLLPTTEYIYLSASLTIATVKTQQKTQSMYTKNLFAVSI